MTDNDMQASMHEAGEQAAGAVRRTAEAATHTARKAADAVTDTAKVVVEAEQRSFACAEDAGRQSAAAIGQAAQTSLKAGQDMARRVGDQAADLWSGSLTPVAQMTNEFNHWVEHMWRRASSSVGMRGGLPMAMLAPFTGHPLADLRETDQGFELCVDLPGFKPDEITLVLRADNLVVSGERAEESEGRHGVYRFAERRFGRVERTFALPPGAERDNIDATFQDGVLRVKIPAPSGGDPGQTIPVKG